MMRKKRPSKSGREAWERCDLSKELASREAQSSANALQVLQLSMQTIVPVLRHGSSSPLDFSLHDVEHSDRVAIRMAQIMPAGLLRKMADEEIALLLLAAYLHDIGMTPEVGHVRKFYAFILAGDSTGLTEGEKSELTNWVSDQHPEINLPLVVDRQVTTEDLRSAEYLCAHFCRWKHNDWSEAWIRRHLSSVSWKGYSEWLPDLITLCRSHHESYGELKSDRFLPRVVSSREKAVVHLRYLACVLRIADILEFDPERTPEIVMKHRDVSKESAIYWYKDHSVHLAFNLRDKQILLGATPKNASMHKAILCMADEIDAELLLCKRL